MDSRRPPLRWMAFEAGGLGLRTALFERDIAHERSDTPSNKQSDVLKESLTGIWWLLEWLPIAHLTCADPRNSRESTRMSISSHSLFYLLSPIQLFRPHLGAPRIIHDGQKIHNSLLLAQPFISREYIPNARPVRNDHEFWEKVRGDRKGQWVEFNFYDDIDDRVKRFVHHLDKPALEGLLKTASQSGKRTPHLTYSCQ